jgi:hypothetical protein
MEVQPTEMDRDFVESKGLANVGYSDTFSRFWIRRSVNFKILNAKFHILGRKAQAVGIIFRVWTKMYHLIDHFVEFFGCSKHLCECSNSSVFSHQLRQFFDGLSFSAVKAWSLC